MTRAIIIVAPTGLLASCLDAVFRFFTLFAQVDGNFTQYGETTNRIHFPEFVARQGQRNSIESNGFHAGFLSVLAQIEWFQQREHNEVQATRDQNAQFQPKSAVQTMLSGSIVSWRGE
ncbi:MAG: hypothetical protein ACYC3N_04190 [Halothiobacillus sp.]